MKYYLYIKTSPFGLKYLGKTTKDPLVYIGSGKIWKRHILKHNLTSNDINTDIVFETTDLKELISKGVELSKYYNIVESKEWANLREERGDGGDTSNFIDFSNPVFHIKGRADHLNFFNSEEEKKRVISERTSKIDYKSIERKRKIKENTDWGSWIESIKKRKTDYSKFLDNIHENNKKPILQFDKNGNFIREYKSAIDASKELNINVSGIRHCLTKRNKTAFGYIWKYKNIINESK